MERRNELKSKARELEHDNRLEEALKLYLQLVERSEQPSPAIWARVGQLQLEMGDGPQAKQSLGHAIRSFAESGHLNLAIALSRRLVDARAAGPDVHLRLGDLALEKGYRGFARESLAEFARAGEADRDLSQVVSRFVRFLGRFPDEQELWRDWVEELLASGRDDQALAALGALADSLERDGFDEQAGAIRAEIDRLAAPVPSAGPPPAVVEDDDHGPADFDDEPLPLLGTAPEPVDSLGVLGNAPEAGADSDAPVVAPLAGLQTTQSDWGFAADPGDTATTRVEPGESTSDSADDAARPADLGRAPWATEGMSRPPSAPPEVPPPGGSTGGDDDGADDRAVLAAPDSLATGAPAGEAAGSGADSLDTGAAESQAAGYQSLPTSPARPSVGRKAPDGADLRSAITALLRLSPRTVDPADDPSTHYDLGVAFKEMGLFDESVAHLAMAVERGHDPVATLEVLGEMLIARGEYELTSALLAPLTSGAGGDPDLVGVHYWLGRSAEERGRADEAQDHYRRALAIEPTFRDAGERLQRIASAF